MEVDVHASVENRSFGSVVQIRIQHKANSFLVGIRLKIVLAVIEMLRYEGSAPKIIPPSNKY